MAAGALAAVRVVRASPEERSKMRETADYLKRAMLEAGLPLMSRETHIMPLLVGDGHKCKAMADELLQRGIYVQPINFPSVPRGEELLRFTASPKHTPQHCAHLLSTLVDVFGKHGLLCPVAGKGHAAEARAEGEAQAEGEARRGAAQ